MVEQLHYGRFATQQFNRSEENKQNATISRILYFVALQFPWRIKAHILANVIARDAQIRHI